MNEKRMKITVGIIFFFLLLEAIIFSIAAKCYSDTSVFMLSLMIFIGLQLILFFIGRMIYTWRSEMKELYDRWYKWVYTE